MNFKDAYKSYNDEIKGNPEVLNLVLSGKAKPKPVFNYRLITAYAAMAALVISVSVFGYNKFYGEPKPTKRYIASTNVGDTKQTSLNEAQNTGNAETDTKKSAAVAENKSAQSTENIPAKISNSADDTISNDAYVPDILPPQADASGSDVKLPEDLTGENVPAEAAELPAAVADEGITDAALPARASSGGGMAAYEGHTPGEAQSVLMTADEYFEYLGVDLVSAARLPGDMVFDEPQSAKLEYEDGIIVSDAFTITAYSTENTQRCLSLSVTKNGSPAAGAADDISYAYADDGKKLVGAYTMVGDISVSLGVQNVTKEEINNLIKSLKTEE